MAANFMFPRNSKTRYVLGGHLVKKSSTQSFMVSNLSTYRWYISFPGCVIFCPTAATARPLGRNPRRFPQEQAKQQVHLRQM